MLVYLPVLTAALLPCWLPPPHPFLHPLRDSRDRGSRPRTRLYHTPSHTHITQHQTAPQNTAQPPHNTPLPSCPSTSFTPSPISSPPPPPAPLILPLPTPPNPHFTPPQTNNRDAANSGTEHHRPAMDAGKRAPAYQLLAQSGPGLSALPMVVHGARNGLCPSPVTNRVRDTGRFLQKMREGGKTQMQDAGWVGGVAHQIAEACSRAPGGAPGSRCLP